jgi:protein-tyrosine phosphatase
MEKTNVLEKIRNCILKKQKVFVFCNSGIQKSASVIACYLMKYSKITPKEAVRFIKSKHPIAFLDDIAYISAMEYFHRQL